MEDKWDEITDYCCATCRFYVPKTDRIGRCRRHAPTMNGYPVAYPSDDFCGDHKVGTNPLKASFLANKEIEVLDECTYKKTD